MLEVEQKFAISDKNDLLHQLDHIGARRGDCLKQQDHYFAHPIRNFAETDEAIRIRCNGSNNRITYKGPKLSTISKVRQEIELEFESGQRAFEQLAEMLEILGFQPLKAVKKVRTPFSYSHGQHTFEITIDEVEELGTFAEIELMAEESELTNAEEAIIELARSLGLSNPIRHSYLGMLLENEP
ncbi:class IV adenylate cyclase [Gimesia aquarii]|uniref:CYTH domain protein n=1 Tax=Gimesia aquarii TaxID=2527964 RepID=A0A517W198_9PLAN|nr:class IV adenylate cyclase [Gimesia aquarii]QDT99019.1 CYTH domain protein [Gimesia aquarii]